MSYNNGPKTIVSGLIACFDAGNHRSFVGEPTVNMINSQSLSPTAYAYCTGPVDVDADTRRYTITSAVNTARGRYDVSASIGIDYTFSCLLKYNGSNTLSPTFDISAAKPSPESGNTISLTTSTQTSSSIDGGWYRLVYTFNILSNTAPAVLLTFGVNTGADNAYAGSTFDIRQPQLEAKSYATPYVSGSRGNSVSAGGGWNDLTGNQNVLSASGIVGGLGCVDFRNNTSGSGAATSYMISNINNQSFKTDIVNGCSGFVMFNNTASHNGAALPYFRQTVYGFGYDSALGGWHIARYSGSSGFIFSHKFDQDGTYGTGRAFGAVNFNEWVQLGFALDGVNLKLYKNGVPTATIGTTTYTLTSSISSTATLGVGAMTNVGNNALYGFIGQVGHASFYSRKLSDAEVLQNYYAIKGRFEP